MKPDIAFIFPGFGSQQDRMGSDLVQAFPYLAKKEGLFDQFDNALSGLGLSQYRVSNELFVRRAPDTEFESPIPSDIATLGIPAVSMATVRVLEEECGLGEGGLISVKPLFVGHSLGEYSAIMAAGLADIGSMATALNNLHRISNVGSMVALTLPQNSHLDDIDFHKHIRRILDEVCRELPEQICVLANDNAPHQVVISGNTAAVGEAVRKAKELNMRIHLIANDRAGHSPLGKEQERQVPQLFNGLIRPTQQTFRWMPNGLADIAMNPSPDEIIRLLAAQRTGPVLWRQSVLRMQELGITHVIECGAGNVLSNLVRRIAPELKVITLSSAENIKAFLNSGGTELIRSNQPVANYYKPCGIPGHAFPGNRYE